MPLGVEQVSALFEKGENDVESAATDALLTSRRTMLQLTQWGQLREGNHVPIRDLLPSLFARSAVHVLLPRDSHGAIYDDGRRSDRRRLQ